MRLPGDSKQEKIISEIIRVDHAGELGAKMIYKGQLKALKNNKNLALIEHMLEQEIAHYDFFDQQIKQRKIRPSLFYPIWQILGYGLGMVGAKISYKHAMLCTEKIEEVIDIHYQEQIKILDDIQDEKDLKGQIEKFREDEVHHRQIAIEHKSKESVGYIILGGLVAKFCKLAINIAKKI